MTKPTLLALLVAAACGDDLTGRAGDAGREPPDSASGGNPPATAFAVGTDFVAAGIASTVAIPSLEVVQNAVDGVASTDPVVRHQDGRLYLVNRLGHDNVTVLEADTLALVAQVSTGPGSNPQDAAADGQVIYVPVLGGAGVAVIDLARPDDGVVDTIDLSDLDADGAPDCHSAVRVGRRLAVVCGVLDGDFQPRRRGQVAIIDLDSGARVAVIPLQHRRPFGFAAAASGALAGQVLVATVPQFLDPAADGCLERIDLAADPPVSRGCLVDNQALGGFPSGVAADGERVWLAVTTGFDPDDFGPLGYAAAWSAAAGAMEPPATGDLVRAMDVAACPDGSLVVADATLGVRVYDAAGHELTTGPLDIGLPPVSNGLTCF